MLLSLYIMSVTVVVTSCNRPSLLKPTLKSFFHHNTYTIDSIIIIDDSGKKGCIDCCIEEIPINVKKTIIYNEKNIGQIQSIDKAYSYVNTEYIFHCEDDWEFYNPGFIEKSIRILNSDNSVFCVWLRPYKNNVVLRNGHPVITTVYNNEYRKLGTFKERNNIWCGFTFNPGLRRKCDYILNAPYSKLENKDNLCGGIEAVLSKLYYQQNFCAAITTNENGYVNHIGWNQSTNS